MIIIIFLVILFRTLTIVNSYTSQYKMNSNCHCTALNIDNINIIYNPDEDTELTVNVKSWDNLEIICNSTDGWKDFNFTSKLPGKIINSLHFKQCGLSNKTSLNDVARKLGVEETSTLIFQSYHILETALEREHLQGFPHVTKLVLSYSSLSYIPNDLFSDFPKLEWLDLSYNDLILIDDIFDETPNLKGINLAGNELRSINQRLFSKLENLEYLNLMSNSLLEIELGVFDKLVSLKSLNLSRNSLIQIPSSIFNELKKLETIDLSHNSFINIPSKLFTHNKELRQLFFHNNGLYLRLSDNFLSNLRKLEKIVFHSDGLSKLPENLFWGSTSLKHIDLSNNHLITLPLNIFIGLRNLEYLSLNRNLIINFPARIFKDLGRLKKLDLSMNVIGAITKNLFKGLTSLTELNMERNAIQFIEPLALFPMTNLLVAKLSHNQLTLNTTSRKWSPFYNNRILEELHLSNNSIESFFSDWSLSKSNLKLLNLSHNKIRIISVNDFIFPSNKITVDLRYNNIKKILLKEIEELAIYQSDERDVFMFIEHNPILCDCQLYDLLRYREHRMPLSVYNYFKIKMNNLSCFHLDGSVGSNLEELDSTTYKCIERKHFRAGRRNCQVGCTCYVRPEDNTRILDCSYSNMSQFWIDKLKLKFVKDYPLILNFTGNLITEIPPMNHLKYINITGLLLSNNRISKLTDKLPESLTILELHNNNISEIYMDIVAYLTFTYFQKLTLSGNPIICNCNTKDFLRYVQDKRFYYKDLDNVICKNYDLPIHLMTKDQMCSFNSKKKYRSNKQLNDKGVELNETETYVRAEI